MAVKDYTTNPDENTTISDINIAEGCPPSGINNAIRQLMADVKVDHDAQKSTNTKLAKVMTGATASAPGTSGNVPAPQAGDNNKALFGDGKYKEVVQSVGGALPDSNGDIEAPYLPLSGGILTGQLKFNLPGAENSLGLISAKNDQYGKRFNIDTWEEGDIGALITLRKGSDTINPGGYEISARNSDGSISKVL